MYVLNPVETVNIYVLLVQLMEQITSALRGLKRNGLNNPHKQQSVQAQNKNQ